MQTQPVMDTGTENSLLSFSDVSFDTDKYIAEVNPQLGSLTLAPDQESTSQKNIEADIRANQDVAYVLSGNFV